MSDGDSKYEAYPDDIACRMCGTVYRHSEHPDHCPACRAVPPVVPAYGVQFMSEIGTAQKFPDDVVCDVCHHVYRTSLHAGCPQCAIFAAERKRADDNGPTQTPESTFDPSRYLTKVGSADYLEVKWRLVWLRETQPYARVDTELISHDGQEAVFRARVEYDQYDAGADRWFVSGATGWGSEAADDFRDYLEKAETKALGRALAALGFGTQFCPDFDFGSPVDRSGNTRKVVDAPVAFASTRGRRLAESAEAKGTQSTQTGQAATPRQIKFMEAVGREAGLSAEDLVDEVMKTYGCAPRDMSRRNASNYIERLQNRRGSLDISS